LIILNLEICISVLENKLKRNTTLLGNGTLIPHLGEVKTSLPKIKFKEAPGSGKTTDAELIAEQNNNITHYSTGDMLRAEVASGSEIGKELDSYMSKGLIVPIEMAIKTITNAIKNAPTDVIIIDGYPRSMEQLNALDEYLQNDSSLELISVIEVAVSEEMKVYIEPLNIIQAFYSAKGILKIISGEGNIKEIVSEMETFINSKI